MLTFIEWRRKRETHSYYCTHYCYLIIIYSSRSYESSYPIASHHDSLSRGVHPSGLNRVNPKPHQQLRRHTSDRSHHHSRGKLNHDTASNQIASLSSGYVSADLRTSDYPHLRRSRGSASDYTAYKERDVTHSTTSSDINTSGYHQLRPSSSSLDRHSFSDGSQSSFTGSSAEATNRVPPSHVGGVDRGYRGSPASSQSDFSDHRHLHQRYGNRLGLRFGSMEYGSMEYGSLELKVWLGKSCFQRDKLYLSKTRLCFASHSLFLFLSIK